MHCFVNKIIYLHCTIIISETLISKCRKVQSMEIFIRPVQKNNTLKMKIVLKNHFTYFSSFTKFSKINIAVSVKNVYARSSAIAAIYQYLTNTKH